MMMMIMVEMMMGGNDDGGGGGTVSSSSSSSSSSSRSDNNNTDDNNVYNNESIRPGAQTRLKSWGDQDLGPNTGARPAKGRAGCWMREGVAPASCEGPGVSPPEIFWKLRCWILHSGDYLLWNFLLFENYGQEVGGPIHCWSSNLTVRGPVFPGPYGCCAYASGVMHRAQEEQHSSSNTRGSLKRECGLLPTYCELRIKPLCNHLHFHQFH